MTIPARCFTRWLPLAYLVLVGAISSIYGVKHMFLADGWGIGEWLTNYSGGFVRRGLPGQAILLLHRATGIGLPLLVLLLQLAVYPFLLGCVWVLVRRVRWSFALLALFLSPATLAFIVLDPPNGFKKEILLFAALAGVLVLLERARPAAWQIAGLLSLLGVTLILAHEALLCYLPFLAAPVVLERGVRDSLRILALPALLSLVAGIAAARHPGTLAVASAICTSLGSTLPAFGTDRTSLCGGSIVWLTQTPAQAHRVVLNAIPAHHYLRLYVPLGLLAVAPAIVALRELMRRGLRREAVTIATCGGLAWCASLPVYASGLDWGRWIHMEAMCLLLLLLSVSGRGPAPALQRTNSRLAWLALALYATCWTLPAVPIYPARLGYLGVVRYLTGYGKNHPQRGFGNQG